MSSGVWRKHYRGMHKKDSCEAGVSFSSLPGHGSLDFMNTCPCFGPQLRNPCDKAEYPTADEIAEQEKESVARFQNMMNARAAIVEHCGGPWKRGMPGQSGEINCPVCGGEAALRFSRAGYNGHIHAGCKTEGCVRWME